MAGKESRFSLQDEIRDLFSRFTDEWPDLAPLNQNGFVPHIDVKEESDHFFVVAEIPGMQVDDIHLTIDKDILTIEGEKKCDYKEKEDNYSKSEISYGHFHREIPLMNKVDEDAVEASYRDGVLRVKMMKSEGKGKNKRILIQTQSNVQ